MTFDLFEHNQIVTIVLFYRDLKTAVHLEAGQKPMRILKFFFSKMNFSNILKMKFNGKCRVDLSGRILKKKITHRETTVAPSTKFHCVNRQN